MHTDKKCLLPAIKQKNVISEAIDEIQSKTCIKLRPRAGEKDYVSFENDNSGCWSPNAFSQNGLPTIVSLKPGKILNFIKNDSF